MDALRDHLPVSPIGLGCNNFGRQASATVDAAGSDAVLGSCLDHGITFFDTAALYGGPESLSEEYIGRSLAHGALKGRRDDVIIATKFGHSAEPMAKSPLAQPRGSRAYIRKAVDGSLRRLRTDWIDLFQMHEPDSSTPLADTLEALSELVQEGKVRFIGWSNVNTDQMGEADEAARTKGLVRFISVQNELSLLQREAEREVLPACAELGLGFLPYFPLASGLLTGKYRRDEPAAPGTRLATSQHRYDTVTAQQWDQLDMFASLCRSREISMLQGSLGWLLAQPQVSSVIAGATTPQQVAANATAGMMSLDDAVVAEISDLFS